MNKLASRRAFLRGAPLREDRTAIIPPGADEDHFFELCVQCDDCVSACPEHIITFDRQGWPVVSLEASPCTFCGACAEACTTGALKPENLSDWPWRAQVTPGCLSMNGVSCRVCQDVCDSNAIGFKLLLGGRSEPAVDQEACTGCGACASACPANTIRFERHETLPQESLQ